MQWCIDDAQVFLALDHLRINADAVYLLQVDIINVLAYNLNQIRIALELDVLRLHLSHLVDDALIMWGQHLSAIVPISLVAIVLTRVVACCDVDTCLASQMTDSKAHLWCRTHIVEEINLDAIGGEDICALLCKEAAVVTTVVPHHHRNLIQILEILVQIVGKALSCSTYGVDVHTIGSCTHDATQTTCTKFQHPIEAVYKLCFILTIEHSLHFFLCLGIVCRSQPFLGFLCDLLYQFFIFHIILVLRFIFNL